MARKDDVWWDEHAQEAAYLFAQHKILQTAIGEVLGCSQSQVSRLLKHAEAKGWLKTTPRFIDEGISHERIEKLKRLLEPRRLVEALQPLAAQRGIPLKVSVFDSGWDGNTPEVYQERLKTFGYAVAGRIQEVLRHASIVGVTWGNTLSQVIEGLASVSSHTKPESAIQFVPVCAELVRLEDTGIDYSSSRLAHRLSEVINQRQVEHLSLAGMPAFMPKPSGRANELLRQYLIDSSASYRKIFTDESCLIDRADIVLTSVGSFSEPYPSRVKSELIKALGNGIEKMEELILGDLGGVLIPRPDINAQDRKLIQALHRMWTGLKMSHLEHIARVASANQKRYGTSSSGNVVVAMGTHRVKAAVIYEAIRLGLVNELIIDRTLARALEQIAKQTNASLNAAL